MSSFRTFAELVRLPNVFSAVADILLGAFLAHGIAGGTLFPWLGLPLVLGATVCLYWAGMVLNDFFDADADAELRPNRPIPSGRISRANAGRFGFGLLIGGIALAYATYPVVQSWRPAAMALCVATSVLAYDGGAKRTALGPLAMGACRFFNVLLGAALIVTALPAWFMPPVWFAAAGVGTYIVGVTLFARTEAVLSSRPQLIAATAIMIAGLGLVAVIPHLPEVTGGASLAWWWWPLMIAFMLRVMCQAQPAVRDPSPQIVQPTIGRLLRQLILLDAFALFPGNMYVAVGLLLLIPLARLTGRWAYST